ncbi:MAG: reverse transcriptase domain-containing protein [Cetobacterium sp.]|uniref:reverse transcriptase domain-containing protein n=1 Tax=Cetobacterium sp. TaxID=2071632 RepID=UPI003F390D32
MNYLKIKTSSIGSVKFPMLKDFKSLPLAFELITEVSYSKVESITFVKNEVEIGDFSISKYKKLFKENELNKFGIKELISIMPETFASIKDVEIIRNNLRKSGYTNFVKERFKTKKEPHKPISQIESFVEFKNITITKKNGKIKKRYVCAPRCSTSKKMFRDLKDILEDMVTLEPEMLGLGKGVDKSMNFFDNFDSLVKIDFKDFFNQISYRKFVDGLKHCCPTLDENIVKTIALSVCPYSSLKKTRATYQGLPTSTIGAYIALLPLYKAIKTRLAQEGIKPTIYIDDLCFQANSKAHAFALKKEILQIIRDFKFKVNKEKCKVLYGNKTFFLGINMKTKALPKKRILNIKAALNNYFHEDSEESRAISKPSIIGQLNYIKMISEEQYNNLLSHHKYGNFIREVLD